MRPHDHLRQARRLGMIAALLLANRTPALATRLALDLVDGSHLRGDATLTALPFSAEFGDIQVTPDLIGTVERIDNGTVALTFRNGDRLTGRLGLTSLSVTTLCGRYSIDIELIRTISVLPDARLGLDGLALWNGLGSRAEVENSWVGPGGTYNLGRFVPGRFGTACELDARQSAALTFPRGVLTPHAGCIELWIRCLDFPGPLPWGESPALIRLRGENEGQFAIHFNGNDGNGNGGLCGRAGGLGSAGTARNGAWTYQRALAPGTPATWSHVALVWNEDGIPGTPGDAKTVALFVNGELNSGQWHHADRGEAHPTTLSSGTLSFMASQQLARGRVQYDDIRVWSFAKTDFSDRADRETSANTDAPVEDLTP